MIKIQSLVQSLLIISHAVIRIWSLDVQSRVVRGLEAAAVEILNL